MLSERVIGILADSFLKILIPGLTVTIPLTVISFALAMVIAIAVALIQFAKVRILKDIARFYVWVIRGTPLLVQLFVVFYGLPNIGILIDPFPAAVIVFSINEGAYSAETIRAALEAVPKGQMEAGYSLGFTYSKVMKYILMPQAIKNILPALGNEFITLLKETSVGAYIGIIELTKASDIIASRTYDYFFPLIIIALIYLVMTLGLSKLVNIMEVKLNND